MTFWVALIRGPHIQPWRISSASCWKRVTDVVEGERVCRELLGRRAGYPSGTLPDVFNRETVSLEDYRLRYALYKSDPDLRAVHAAHPFVVTWDDHETENNTTRAPSTNTEARPRSSCARRAAAYRAYWEHQPLRSAQMPNGPDLQLHRRLHWGTLAQFDVLDTRQYRSDQAYGDKQHVPGPESDDPARTMTGQTQENWLIDGWRSSDALWNVMPQQVCFSQRRLDLNAEALMSMDAWDGYRASRDRILAGAKAAGGENLMVLTGDVHVGYAFDIKDVFDDPASKTLGTEIVATSVASGRDGAEKPANWDTYMKANPHLRFYNGRAVCAGRARAAGGTGRLQDRLGRDDSGRRDHDGGVLRERGRQPGSQARVTSPRSAGRRVPHVVHYAEPADAGHLPSDSRQKLLIRGDLPPTPRRRACPTDISQRPVPP
jgi:hypothetical protein